MKITCLHTAQSHVENFTGVFGKEGWDEALDHIVRPDLLARAQTDGSGDVSDDLRDLLHRCEGADAVLCNCSTLGALVEDIAAENVVRIDRPAMEMAARYGKVMLAICLESTRLPSAALFEACAKGKEADVVLCAEAWTHFEAGEMSAFHRSIAQSVGVAMIDAPQTECIVLAQASMAGAAPLLFGLGVPVLTSPELSLRAALDLAT
jgi:hypothetical protein